jgi:hypothetical protein
MVNLWKNNSLSIVLLALFVFSMAGQAWAGWYDYNQDELEHGQRWISFSDYMVTGHFWEATGENWESEFLQMAAFVLLTCFLRQKGSAESKRIDVVEEVDLDPRRFADDPHAPSPVRAGGWKLRLYEQSLGLAFAALFILSVSIHAVGGLAEYNDEQTAHGRPRVTLSNYVASSSFWFESFQNWQSEFLSLAAMVIGTIWLRQRGSAESKPVHAPHDETGR